MLEWQESQGGRFSPGSRTRKHQQPALGGRARRVLHWGRVLLRAGLDFGRCSLEESGFVNFPPPTVNNWAKAHKIA